MKESLKSILKNLGIYHPLQSFYRESIQRIRRIYFRREYAKFKGGRYICNFCCASYSKFVSSYPSFSNRSAIETNKVIAGYGENVICPNCLSTARERLIKIMLETSINSTGKSVLHFSPEKNLFNFLKERAHVTTVDFMPGFYKRVDNTVQFADATRLPFADKSFDLVIANHIMEHIPNDNRAMQEIYRVLKPEGKAILQVPFSTTLPKTIEDPLINNSRMQSAHYGQKDHVRIYQLEDYIKRLKTAGFIVEYIPYNLLEKYEKYAIQCGEGFIGITK